MLAPFMGKWEIQYVPFKAEEPNGFDVITLNNIMSISLIRLQMRLHQN